MLDEMLQNLPPDVVAIPMTNGGYALVDEEDVCRVDEYQWHKLYSKNCKTWYAKSCIQRPDGTRTTLAMHRVIFGLTHEDQITVDHKNHDGLDNRRSSNLRLASIQQQETNKRKRILSTSSYKGVSWFTRYGKWKSSISVRQSGIIKKFHLGLYEIEHEAYFAYLIAAPLIHDPDFLCLPPLDDANIPPSDRQDTIKEHVLAVIKAVLIGQKTWKEASSKWVGVSFIDATGLWRVQRVHDKKLVRFGSFQTEFEAAFAYNVGLEILELSDCKRNVVSETDLVSPERAIEIRNEVRRKIEHPRGKSASKLNRSHNKSVSSRFSNVSYFKSRNRWAVNVCINYKTIFIGKFKTEVEAAIASNLVIGPLGKLDARPNVIEPYEMPSQVVIEAIKAKVDKRLSAITT